MNPLITALLGITLLSPSTKPTSQPGDTTAPLVFTGGHETDPRDGGRPVILVASALGVPPEVFRDVFRGVHPAQRPGGPTGDEARGNKRVLLDGLSKYGVTNDRLDAVSNRYRYRPQDGELLTHQEAAGMALIRGGKVVGVTISDPGFGYSSPPAVTVLDHPEATLTAKIHFGTDLETNGSISAVDLAQ